VAVSNRDAQRQGSRPAEGSNGLDVSTLVITAIASAGAALISSELLGSGTLVSAALTPVVIALLKEALDRPRRVVSTVVPAAVVRPRRRRTARGRAAPENDASPDQPPARSVAGEVHIYRSTGRRWRLAIVTGLLGFALAATVLTVTELAAGGSVGGGSRATTYFGGKDASPGTRDPDRREDVRGDEAPAEPAPSATAPDPAATTPEAPSGPQDGTQEVAPPTSPDPAAPAPPTGSETAPAPGPDPAAPAPEAPPAAPAQPAP
jgi:hypothetical protein